MSEKKKKGAKRSGADLASSSTSSNNNKKAKTRGAKYTNPEVNELLNLVENYLPTGGDEWDGNYLNLIIHVVRITKTIFSNALI